MNQQMDNQLPEGWETTLLENVTIILDSMRIPINNEERKRRIEGKDDSELYPYYGATGEVGKIDGYLFDEELIALGEDGVPFLDAKKNKAYMLNGKTWVNNHAHVLKANPTFCTNKYILYFLNQFNYQDYVNGGTRLKLTQANMRRIPIPLPPLAEQHYLADKLDSLLARIQTLSDQLAAVPALLKQFRQSVLADAVSGKLTAEWRNKNELSISNYQEISQQEKQDKLDKRKIKTASLPHEFAPSITLPESWRWLSLDEACYKITDGTHHSPKSYATGDFMYVTSKNVREGYLDLSNITYVDKATHQEIFSRCNVAYQDVLYIKDGVNTGLSCVNTIEEEISLLSSVAVFKPCSFLHPFYLQHYLNSPVGRQVMLDLMGGTAIKRLTLQKIINSPIPIPPLTEQTEIVRRVEALFALADNIEQQSRAAAERVALLTQSVLAKAFRGELSEQWRREHPDLISGDNSAAALLARIQAERAATGKKSRRA